MQNTNTMQTQTLELETVKAVLVFPVLIACLYGISRLEWCNGFAYKYGEDDIIPVSSKAMTLVEFNGLSESSLNSLGF
jgi:hypothetical protein